MSYGFFSRFGEDFIVYTDLCPEGRSFRGFLAPVAQTAVDGLHSLSPGGLISHDRFLLIAPDDAFADSESVETIYRGNDRFRLLRCDRLKAPGSSCGHLEAVLRLEDRGESGA